MIPFPRSCALGASLLCWLLTALPAAAEEALALRNARVLTGAGEVLDGATIVIRNGKIEALGRDSAAPSGVPVRDLSGRTVFPGLIDAGARLGGPEGETSPDVSALDAFDRFDPATDRLLAGGVTTVLLSPPGRTGLLGRAALVKLGVPDRAPLREEAGLRAALALGGDRSSTEQRHQEWSALRRALEQAQEYAKTWEKYEKDLAAYQVKKAEYDRQTGGKASGSPPAGDGGGAAPGGGGGRRRRPDTSNLSPEERQKLREEFQKRMQERREEGGEDPPAPAGREEGGGGTSQQKKTDETKQDEKKPDGEAPEEKKPEPPRPPVKPRRPRKDAAQEVVARTLRGELPLLLEAQREDDLRTALRLAEEFRLRLVVLGGGAAGRLTSDLVRLKVPVIWGPLVRFDERLELKGRDDATPAKLRSAGVPFAFGTLDDQPSASRFLPLGAAETLRSGLSADDALAAITSASARILGVEDRVGTLAPGRDADLVVATGSPFDPASRVELVLVDGKVAWERKETR
jgi:imidazolonepropionase-like amidohydrolase